MMMMMSMSYKINGIKFFKITKNLYNFVFVGRRGLMEMIDF